MKPAPTTPSRRDLALARLRSLALALVPYEYGVPGYTARPARVGDPPPPKEERYLVLAGFYGAVTQFALDAARGAGPSAYASLRQDVRAVLNDVALLPDTRRTLLSGAEEVIWAALRPGR